jgi:hypothetical protein
METNMIKMAWTARLRATSFTEIEGLAQIALMRTSETSGLLAVNTAGAGAAHKGTRLSTIAPTTSYKATVSLPISDVVVFNGLAGIRSWSPPV